MTLQQFRSCSKSAQQQIVKHQGIFLLERRSLDWNILLFQVEGFYVEVYYDRKTEKVELLKNFEDTDELEPYLCKIDLVQLMN
jgi:hypothetical protein